MRGTLLTITLCCLALTAAAQPRLSQKSEILWSEDFAWFGGFSGLEMSADGRTMLLVTDQGMLVRASLQRSEGVLTAAALLSARPLNDTDRTQLQDSFADAEGLATRTDGTIFISFERSHRVTKLDPATNSAHPISNNPEFAELKPNRSLEALAVHPDGSLYTLPEQPFAGAPYFPLWRLQNGNWTKTHTIPARGRFLPVGADFDALGRLYLLERSASPLGFRSRIRRFTLPAQTLREEILLTTLPGKFDNLEALSLWRDASGTLHLTMISDDNFLPIQRTQIVEYTLTE